MKKNIKTTLILAIGLTLLLAFTIGASAQPQSYTSGFQVQNLSDQTATVMINFISASTGLSVVQISDTIDPNDSNTYFPLDQVDDGFNGSVVISSDEEVAAIANVLGSDGSDPLAFGASYNGFAGGSTESFLPLLMTGNFGFNTWFNVQNTGSSNIDISVAYSDGTSASQINVAPGAATLFDQSLESHAAGWVGSAVVTAVETGTSTPATIAATVLEVGPTTLFAYDGFTGGAALPVMPLYQANNFGYVTGVQIQNTSSSSSTDVTVTYSPGDSQPGTSCTETRTIPPDSAVSFGLYVFTSFADPNPGSLVSETCSVEQFVGSAAVTTNSNSTDLTVIVNQLNSGANKGAAYNGFDPAVGNERVVFPLIMDRNFGYFTGWNVYNNGSALSAGDVVCTVSGPGGPYVFNSPAIPSGSGWNHVNLNGIADGFVGSASCVGPIGAQLVGSVNEVNVGLGGDAFLVYEGTSTGP